MFTSPFGSIESSDWYLYLTFNEAVYTPKALSLRITELDGIEYSDIVMYRKGQNVHTT